MKKLILLLFLNSLLYSSIAQYSNEKYVYSISNLNKSIDVLNKIFPNDFLISIDWNIYDDKIFELVLKLSELNNRKLLYLNSSSVRKNTRFLNNNSNIIKSTGFEVKLFDDSKSIDSNFSVLTSLNDKLYQQMRLFEGNFSFQKLNLIVMSSKFNPEFLRTICPKVLRVGVESIYLSGLILPRKNYNTKSVYYKNCKVLFDHAHPRKFIFLDLKQIMLYLKSKKIPINKHLKYYFHKYDILILKPIN